MEKRIVDFPEPISSMIEALDSDIRRKILIYIEMKKALAYSDLIKILDLGKGSLNYHLKILISSGLIRNYVEKNNETGYSSYYEVSQLGRAVIDGLFSAFKPVKKTQQEPASSTTTIDFESHTKTRMTVTKTSDSASSGIEEENTQSPVIVAGPDFWENLYDPKLRKYLEAKR